MPITDEMRKRRETALEQGKVAIEGARKPWYAAVGAGNLAYVRLSELQGEVRTRVQKLQTDRPQLDSSMLRKAYDASAAQARDTYESLAHRGEIVVRRVRRSPEIRETFERAEHAVAEAGRAVASTEERITHPGPMTTTAAHRPAAKTVRNDKAPAKHPSHS